MPLVTLQHLFSLFTLRRFMKQYAREDNWHNLDMQTGNLGYGWLHYALIRILQPDRVLVIGSQYGYIPAVCALACSHNNKGKVDFVDAGYDISDHHDKGRLGGGGVGFWKHIDSKKYFGKFGLAKYITFHLMTSQVFAKKYPARNWSYMYIDGDHSYAGVQSDFKNFWSRLRQGGFMALHDVSIQKHQEGSFMLELGVWKFWKELKKKYHAGMIELPGKFGLGLLQKI